MIPDNQFNKMVQVLQDINSQPEQLKRMPNEQRTALMVALNSLENGTKELTSVINILERLGRGKIPKSSVLGKIQKTVLNRFDRVTSAELTQALKKTEQEVLLKQGKALLDAGSDDARAFALLEKAKERGAHGAFAFLGQLFEEHRVPEAALQKYLDQGVHRVQFWSNEANRKRFKVDEHRELARDLYGEGAAKGDPIAQRKLAESNLALFKLNQKPQFKATAISWLKKSAKQGDVEAKLLLRNLGG